MKEKYDVVILGPGPAGLQAAIHAARAKVSVLVMGREHKSSLYKAHVENYCCLGEEKVTGLELDNGDVVEVDGVFIETDKQQQTNVPGIYAAGDICGPPWQVAKAVGEGCVAGLAAAKRAKKIKK
jgi:thioredoxin reductase